MPTQRVVTKLEETPTSSTRSSRISPGRASSSRRGTAASSKPARPPSSINSTRAGLEEAGVVAGLFGDFLGRLARHLYNQSQERTLVITHLHEAAYWAERAIAAQPANQEG